MTAEVAASAPGLDLERLAEWFPTAMPDLGGSRLAARLISGGRSNLTYEISAGDSSWVLRRPPLGHVLATAHDVAREYRVTAALAGTAVPVPVTYALCSDPAVIGAPFYLMEKVDGFPFRTTAELAPLGEKRVRAISLGIVDTLVALHDVDPAAVGLADLGRAEGFLARQVRRWSAQLESSRSRDLRGADELRDLLADAVPPQGSPGIVHGDFRLDNVLIDGSDRPAAVIDWEMATIGDPLTDLALLLVYQEVSRLPGGGSISDAAAAPGYATQDEVRERYLARGGRDTADFGFYLALAAYKLAAIAEGVHYRRLQSRAAGGGLDRIDELTEPILRLGLAALKENH